MSTRREKKLHLECCRCRCCRCLYPLVYSHTQKPFDLEIAICCCCIFPTPDLLTAIKCRAVSSSGILVTQFLVMCVYTLTLHIVQAVFYSLKGSIQALFLSNKCSASIVVGVVIAVVVIVVVVFVRLPK